MSLDKKNTKIQKKNLGFELLAHEHNTAGRRKTTAGLTGLPAGFTVSTVTGLLAAVKTTVQLVTTDQGALVFHSLMDRNQ